MYACTSIFVCMYICMIECTNVASLSVIFSGGRGNCLRDRQEKVDADPNRATPPHSLPSREQRKLSRPVKAGHHTENRISSQKKNIYMNKQEIGFAYLWRCFVLHHGGREMERRRGERGKGGGVRKRPRTIEWRGRVGRGLSLVFHHDSIPRKEGGRDNRRRANRTG